MEQHPIPRNISSFQFHLIGDMTLSQFLFLAGGAAVAFVIFKAAPFPSIIRYLLAGAVGFIGFAFAFIPIQERPLDKWIVAFLKSIFAPTQFVWQKSASAPDILLKPQVSTSVKTVTQEHIDAHKEAKEKLVAYLATLPKSPHENLNKAEQSYIKNTLMLFGPDYIKSTPSLVTGSTQPASIYPAFSPVSKIPPVYKTSPLEPINSSTGLKPASSANLPPINHQPVDKITDFGEIAKTSPVQQLTASTPSPKPQASQIKTPEYKPITPLNVSPQPTPESNSSGIEEKLKNLALEKEILSKQLEQLKKELEVKEVSPQIITPQPPKTEAEPSIKYISPKNAVNEVGLPTLPQYPNIVIGVVKDPQKKVLPNIIVTIKDKAGTPLRALKTNKLGQFVTATPLPNGIYLLEIEDPLKRYVFDIAEIQLTGKVFLPLEIITKGEKELLREKLAKELFGSIH